MRRISTDLSWLLPLHRHCIIGWGNSRIGERNSTYLCMQAIKVLAHWSDRRNSISSWRTESRMRNPKRKKNSFLNSTHWLQVTTLPLMMPIFWGKLSGSVSWLMKRIDSRIMSPNSSRFPQLFLLVIKFCWQELLFKIISLNSWI